MSSLKYISLLFLIFLLQGCTYRKITDYENCVSSELTFEFKDDINLYIIDDSNGEYKYSSMNFPNKQYYLFICSDDEDTCKREYSGQYYQGWKLIKIKSTPFYLTGKYKINQPQSLLSAFAPKTSALQIYINGTYTWVSDNELNDINLKNISKNSIKELHKNRRLTTDWNDWMTEFQCPNPNVKEIDTELIW